MTSPRPHSIDRVSSPVAGERHFGLAWLAVLAHALVLALLVRFAVPVPPQAGDPPGFALLFTRTLITTAPAPRVKEVLPVTPAVTEAPKLHAAAPIRLARPAQSHHVSPAPARLSAAPAAPAALPPAGLTPPAAPANDGVALARLRGAISQAVQAVAEMPAAARLQRRQGRAQVGFAYQDGTVAEPTLLQSSQSHVLDQAALNAVMRARYPSPPANLRGRRLSLQVWVAFTLAAQTPI